MGGCLCPGDLCPEGVSVRGVSVREITWGRYASCWIAFLFKISSCTIAITVWTYPLVTMMPIFAAAVAIMNDCCINCDVSGNNTKICRCYRSVNELLYHVSTLTLQRNTLVSIAPFIPSVNTGIKIEMGSGPNQKRQRWCSVRARLEWTTYDVYVADPDIFKQLRVCPMFTRSVLTLKKGRRIEYIIASLMAWRYVLLIGGCVKKHEMSVVALRSYKAVEDS